MTVKGFPLLKHQCGRNTYQKKQTNKTTTITNRFQNPFVGGVTAPRTLRGFFSIQFDTLSNVQLLVFTAKIFLSVFIDVSKYSRLFSSDIVLIIYKVTVSVWPRLLTR